MTWARLTVALLAALSLSAPLVDTPSPPARPLVPKRIHFRLVAADGVEALVPPKWEFRPLSEPRAGPRKGIQASTDLSGWSPRELATPGMESYWVDATEVGVPSDYYQLAARGPVAGVLDQAGCRSEERHVVEPPALPPGSLRTTPPHYVATISGHCAAGTRETRWASFVAAPGFSAVRELGIPQSGLYVVRASVPDGPRAEELLHKVMSSVSFGGTPVESFLEAAGLPPKLP